MSRNESGAERRPAGPPAPFNLNFIVDAPASHDELDAHEPIAKAITAVVRGADRIKMIGLIGGWGSGKSTVAQLAKTELEKTAPGQPIVRCFTFDAWQHQSDPPRRAFLEALAQYLETDEAFKDLRTGDDDPVPEWKEKLEHLRVLTETTKTTTTPTLTLPGKLLALSAIGLPIGFKLVGDGTLSAGDQRDPAASLLFLLGWVLVLAPPLVLIGLYLAWRPWKELRSLQNRSDFWRFLSKHRKAHSDHSIISLIANKAVEHKTDVRQKTPDPTAIEFQDSFRDMVAEAHTKNRRLVLIVDNLDRLPPEEAKTIWATVRSLFLGGDAKRKISRENLPTVIMPIDASSIDKMYGRGAGQALSRSFLEKTFDLVFHVPAPVLSRWHRYMRDKLREVFGADVSEHDLSNIKSIYERWLGLDKPTPRSINNFVNAIAALWLQRRNDMIDIAIVAYYVTERDVFTKDFDSALGRDVEILDVIDRDWRAAVAALHSGLSREDAGELFMDGPIRSAILSGEQSAFDTQFSRPGFDRYLMRVLRDDDPNAESIPILTAAALLGANEPAPWMAEAWFRLRKASLLVDDNTEFASKDVEGLSHLVASVSGAERQRYLTAMAAALGKASYQKTAKEGGRAYAALAQRLIELAHAAGLDTLEIEIPGGANGFYLILLQGLPDDVLAALLPTSTSFDEIVAGMSERLQSGPIHKGVPAAAAALARRSPTGIDWQPLFDSCKSALTSEEDSRVASGVRTMVGLYPLVGQMSEQISRFQDEGVLAAAWATTWNSKDERPLAGLTALLISNDGPINPPSGHTWQDKLATNPELPALVGEAIDSLNISPDLVWLVSRMARAPQDAPLLKGLAGRLVEDPTYEGVDKDIVLENFAGFDSLVPPESRERFWNEVAGQEGFWNALDRRSPAEKNGIFHVLLGTMINRARLGKALKSHLENVSREDWLKVVRSAADPYDLLSDLDRTTSQVSLGNAAFMALRDLVPELLSSEDDDFRSRWFLIAGRLMKALRRSILHFLADNLGGGVHVAPLVDILTRGGPELLEKFDVHPDRTVLGIVSALADSEDGLRWLIDREDQVQAWVDRSGRDTRFTLAEQLKAVEGSTAATALLAKLGLSRA